MRSLQLPGRRAVKADAATATASEISSLKRSYGLLFPLGTRWAEAAMLTSMGSSPKNIPRNAPALI
jgi:hypothetical protein